MLSYFFLKFPNRLYANKIRLNNFIKKIKIKKVKLFLLKLFFRYKILILKKLLKLLKFNLKFYKNKFHIKFCNAIG